MIKNILFDLDGTLFNFEECERSALVAVFKIYNRVLSLDEIHLYQKINESLWSLFERQEVDREYVLNNRFAFFLEKIQFSAPPEQVNELFLYFLSGTFCLEYGALDILLKLRPNFRLYIITNGVELVQSKKMAAANLNSFFDRVFISESIGFSKPNPAFFDYCLSEIGSTSDQCLVVGDSLLSDIAGGNNAGMITCWYNPKNKQNETGIIPDFEISHLLEINRIIQEIDQIT